MWPHCGIHSVSLYDICTGNKHHLIQVGLLSISTSRQATPIRIDSALPSPRAVIVKIAARYKYTEIPTIKIMAVLSLQWKFQYLERWSLYFNMTQFSSNLNNGNPKYMYQKDSFYIDIRSKMQQLPCVQVGMFSSYRQVSNSIFSKWKPGTIWDALETWLLTLYVLNFSEVT